MYGTRYGDMTIAETGRHYNIFTIHDDSDRENKSFIFTAIPANGNKPKGVYRMRVSYTKKQEKIAPVHKRFHADVNMFMDMIARKEVRRDEAIDDNNHE